MLVRRLTLVIFIAIICLSLLSGCRQTDSEGSITVWLDVPLDGLMLAELQEINIKGHAEAKDVVQSVEIWINGELIDVINNPPMQARLAAFSTKWAPETPGEYAIQAVAMGMDDTISVPDVVLITFGVEVPVLEEELVDAEIGESQDIPPVAEDPPASDTPVTEPKATIQFWADPPQIEAGDCTTIRWRVENAYRVIFEGSEQPLAGNFRDCLCENKIYSLLVINLDGSEERRTLEVRVTGSCVTPQPPSPPEEPAPDTTPPPVPTPVAPADGLDITCKPAQSMAWLPVTDPSGISEYLVEVQRHSGDNNWQLAPGGSLTGIQGKEASVSVECGWYYRWRVRAVDGAGNRSPWSGWSHFAILLM